MHAHCLLPGEKRWVTHTGSAAFEEALRRVEVVIELPSGYVFAEQPAPRERIEWRHLHGIPGRRGRPALLGERQSGACRFVQHPTQRSFRRGVVVKASTHI